MFEWLETAAAAWRTIVHISEWSGLSVGALAAGAGLVWLRPALLKPVVLGGVGVLLLYLGVIHGDRVGRADVNAQWADARKAAIAAERERDAMVEQQLEGKYQPIFADLQQQAAERKARAENDERKIASLSQGKAVAKGKVARGVCELGAAADRVRQPRK